MMLDLTVYRGGALEFRVPYPEGTDKDASVHIQASEEGGTEEIRGFAFVHGDPSMTTGGIVLEDDAILFKATSTDTTAWEPGTYILQLWVAQPPAGNAVVSMLGKLRVKRSVFVDDTDASPKTWRENVLAQAQAALLTASESGEIQFSVEGVSYSYESRRSLLQFIRSLEREVAVQRGRKRRPVIQMGL